MPLGFSERGRQPLDLRRARLQGARPAKALAARAGISHATWKMFRHSMTTHGKQWFGINKAQMSVQLRHDDEETQEWYDSADLANLRAAMRGIDFRRE
jgi:hypothetical protein